MTKTLINFDIKMLNSAFDIAKKSPAEKRKVGAVVVDMATESIVSYGYNKMFEETGFLDCENHLGQSYECVVHAEELAVVNMFKLVNYSETISKHCKTIYCTYSPCMNCCKMIVHAGIKRVVFVEEHKTNFVTREVMDGFSPKEFLTEVGIEVVKYNKSTVFNTLNAFETKFNGRKKYKCRVKKEKTQ
jgi:deoxycytidylate deaminase